MNRRLLVFALTFCLGAPLLASDQCGRRLHAMRRFFQWQLDYVDILMALGDMGHTEIIGADGMRTPDYSTYFSSVLPENTFVELLRRRGPGHRHVLELAGSAVFIDPAETDSLTGVRLTVKTFADAPPDPDAKRDQVAGDLYRHATARATNANRSARGIPHYDLIVIRPIGGLVGVYRDTEEDIAAYGNTLLHVLNRYAAYLAPDGEIFAQLDKRIAQTDRFARWVSGLQEIGYRVTQGVTRASHTPVIRITRTPGAPARFPAVE